MLVGHLQKTKKESKNSKKQKIHDLFIKTNRIKLVFNMTCLMEILKNLTRRTASGKILHDNAFNIAKNAKNDGYQHGLASMVYKFTPK